MKEIKVFQIDDDLDQIKIFEKLCNTEENIIHKGFTTVKDFLECIKNEQPDICFIDVNLSEGAGAGFVVLEAIRNKYSNELPVFIISRRGSKQDIAWALELGATDYIIKPIDPFFILEKIKSITDPKHQSDLPLKEMKNPVIAKLNLSIRLLRMDNNYIYIQTKSFIKKHSTFEISHNIIGQIFGSSSKEFRVHDCNLNDETGHYDSQLVAVKDDEEYYAKIHNFLTTNR